MKRRIFIKMSAAGLAYPTLSRGMPSWPMDELPATAIPEDVALAGFPLKVRPVGPGGPLTPWIATTNNAKKLVLEQMRPCQIIGIEIQVEFPDMDDFTVEKLIHMPATFFNDEQQDVTLVWDRRGIIDPIIDDD
jgi:hypothetical protein